MSVVMDVPHEAAAEGTGRDEAKDAPLYEDIRLLGQILGEIVREQEGEAAFELIEAIRRLSVAYERKADAEAGRNLDRLLKRLSPAEAVSVIRAFSYFSHLANLAEDRHHLRRRAVHEARDEAQNGSLELSFQRLADARIGADQVARTLSRSWVSPVLTAHPTEVQRKSQLDAERAIADLLAARDGARTVRERRANEAGLRARIAQLWQTRVLRVLRLTVADEIENALGYYRSTFLKEIPHLYADIEERLGRPVAPFFRMGNWIGGDRDGNPNVDAGTLAHSLRRHAETVLQRYLGEMSALGAELSMSRTLVECSGELTALAARAEDDNPRHDDEPYRRACHGIHGRLAATFAVVTERAEADSATAYGSAAEFLADLRVIEESLLRNHGAPLVGARLAPLIRAVEVFGFHLATTDLQAEFRQA